MLTPILALGSTLPCNARSSEGPPDSHEILVRLEPGMSRIALTDRLRTAAPKSFLFGLNPDIELVTATTPATIEDDRVLLVRVRLDGVALEPMRLVRGSIILALSWSEPDELARRRGENGECCLRLAHRSTPHEFEDPTWGQIPLAPGSRIEVESAFQGDDPEHLDTGADTPDSNVAAVLPFRRPR